MHRSPDVSRVDLVSARAGVSPQVRAPSLWVPVDAMPVQWTRCLAGRSAPTIRP